MKIILSRKGFDSGYGGYPSCIMPDGKMVSLPIPEIGSRITFDDLRVSGNQTYRELMEELKGKVIKLPGNGKVALAECGAHLDPDIEYDVIKRLEGWRGLMGQVGAAQTHLYNQGVGAGDIFLYFGWFRRVEYHKGKYRFSPEDSQGSHVLYGYLEIDRVVPVSTLDPEDWMKYHVHFHGSKSKLENNTLYVAREYFSQNVKLKGYGVFSYTDGLKLTKPGYSRSRWDLPSIFKDVSITYHSDNSWKEDYFQAAMKGQEFVVECNPEIKAWVKDIIESGHKVLDI